VSEVQTPGDDLLALALDLRSWAEVHRSEHARPEPAAATELPAAAVDAAAAETSPTETTPPAPDETTQAAAAITSLPAGGTLVELGEALADCSRCKLHEQRTQVVFGTGSAEAEIVFVGEGPGRNEDLQGEPFVGDAGMLLDRIINNVLGLQSSDVYICNVVKCRPPGNRDPEADEIESCSPFLWQQLDLLQPVVVIALGRFAAPTLVPTKDSVGSLRGRAHPFRDAALLATYHPAYLLRNPGDKRKVFEDMKLVRQVFRERTGRDLPSPPQRGA